MRANELPWIVPATPQQQVEIFETYRVSHAFYREAEYREELHRYCQWYEEVAQQNRRELAKMQGDINLLKWFT